MTDPHMDADLRELFQELRKTDLRGAPPFREVMAKATTMGREGELPGLSPTPFFRAPAGFRRRAAWAAPLVAAAAALVFLILPGNGTTDAEFELAVHSYMADPAGGAWRSPTDGLLRVPGSEVLSTLPKLDGSLLPPLPGTGSRPKTL